MLEDIVAMPSLRQNELMLAGVLVLGKQKGRISLPDFLPVLYLRDFSSDPYYKKPRKNRIFHASCSRLMNTSPLLFFFSLAAMFLFTAKPLAAEPESGKVTVAVGDVTVVTQAGDAPVAIAAGDKVAIGSTIKTGAGARVVVVLTARSAIRIGEKSEVLLEVVDETVLPKKVTVDLKDGSLSALLKPNAAGELDFQVRTPSGVAAARGTFFAVAVKDGKGFAQVKEGRVDVIPAAPAE